MNNSTRTRDSSAKFAIQWILGIPKALIDRIDRLVYPRFIVPSVALLPAPVAYGMAIVHADLKYAIEKKKYPKEIVRCLELVFGDQLSVDQRNRAARDLYRTESCEKIDAMRLLGNGRALLKLVEIHGLEHLKAALADGKGAIVCSGHIGSPKCCYSVIGALGFPVTLIARWSYDRQENQGRLSKLFYRLENGTPVTCHLRQPNINRGSNIFAAIQAAKVVKRNEVLGILIDGGVIKEDASTPISVDFLNGKALLVPGPATIAQLTDAPLLVMVMRRLTDWRHQVLEISPVIVDTDSVSTFRRCLAIVEAAIRRYPGQWKGWSLAELAILGLVSSETAGLQGQDLDKVREAMKARL